jgi:hypothetical protein
VVRLRLGFTSPPSLAGDKTIFGGFRWFWVELVFPLFLSDSLSDRVSPCRRRSFDSFSVLMFSLFHFVYSGYGGFGFRACVRRGFTVMVAPLLQWVVLALVWCFFGAGGWRLRWVVGGADVAGGHCWWLVVVVFQI